MFWFILFANISEWVTLKRQLWYYGKVVVFNYMSVFIIRKVFKLNISNGKCILQDISSYSSEVSRYYVKDVYLYCSVNLWCLIFITVLWKVLENLYNSYICVKALFVNLLLNNYSKKSLNFCTTVVPENLVYISVVSVN